MKASVFIATSLDGYIARENGAIDWLPTGGNEDYGYREFANSVDTIVMGRHTFETVLGFGSWPYDRPVIVLTSRPLVIPEHLADRADVMTGPPPAVVEQLEQRGARHLYVDGGNTITRFLDARLITDLTITRVPVLLGAGIPLFGRFGGDVNLRHVDTRAFANGLVQSRYAVG